MAFNGNRGCAEQRISLPIFGTPNLAAVHEIEDFPGYFGYTFMIMGCFQPYVISPFLTLTLCAADNLCTVVGQMEYY